MAKPSYQLTNAQLQGLGQEIATQGFRNYIQIVPSGNLPALVTFTIDDASITAGNTTLDLVHDQDGDVRLERGLILYFGADADKLVTIAATTTVPTGATATTVPIVALPDPVGVADTDTAETYAVVQLLGAQNAPMGGDGGFVDSGVLSSGLIKPETKVSLAVTKDINLIVLKNDYAGNAVLRPAQITDSRIFLVQYHAAGLLEVSSCNFGGFKQDNTGYEISRAVAMFKPQEVDFFNLKDYMSVSELARANSVLKLSGLPVFTV
jgi:hypothetical protein